MEHLHHDGFLNLNKPSGISSRAAVDQVVRLVGRKRRVGHAGTLDPLASGVLVVGIGSATRLIEYVQAQTKVYRTVIRLGARSDTLDADGTIEEVPNPVVPGIEQVQQAVASQVGTILQVPPNVSALKVGGKRAYDLAREGKAFDLAPRPVVIDRIDLLKYEWPKLELEITCGSGTYIRAIARDIGEALGCGGLVRILIRTRIGVFRIEQAVRPSELTVETWLQHVRPLTDAVAGMPLLRISTEQVARVGRGQPLDVRRVEGTSNASAGEVALLGPDDQLVAIAEFDADAGLIRPRRVLVSG